MLILLMWAKRKSVKSDKSVFNKRMNTDYADYADVGEKKIR